MHRIITIFAFLLLSVYSFSLPVNELAELDERTLLTVSYKVVNNAEGLVTPFKQSDFDSFHDSENGALNVGRLESGQSLLILITVVNNTDQNSYMLDFGNNQVENIELWDIGSERKLLEKSSFIHSVEVDGEENKQFFLRISDSKNNIILVPSVIGVKAHNEIGFTKSVLDGLFFGGLVFIILYNFILFLNFTKNKYLLYYTLYVLFFGSFLFAFDGYLMKIFTDYSQDFHTYMINTGVYCAYAFNILFVSNFLETKIHFKKFYKYLNVLAIILLSFTVVSMFNVPRDFLLRAIDYFAPICMLSVILLAVLSWKNNVKYASLIVYSYIWIIISGLIMILVYNGVLPGYEYKEYILKVGLYGELVILSFAASFSIFKQQVYLRQLVSDELENSKNINKQLQDAKKEVERVSGIKDRFMVNISHELRTPMNAVLGFTNLLESDPEGDDSIDIIKNLKVSAYGLMNAVEDILDFKQLTNEELTANNVTFNLYKSLEYSFSSYSYEARSKGVDIEFNVTQEANNFFFFDNQKVNKLVAILLQNALKFTKKGSVELAVDVIKQDEAGVCFQFVIKDTGIGIPQKELDNVFNSFTQVNDTYTRDYGGTGMGLALFKLIIQFLKGKYNVESGVEQGTKFMFELYMPFSSVNATNRINVTTTSREDQTLVANILLVEDDYVNITIATKYLALISDKINLTVAENGEEAIEQLSKNEFDIVLMDIQMPTMDGYQATKIIRNELGKQIPIVAVTAHALEEEREKCFEVGMTDFLAKPYSKEQLENVILRNINDDDQAYTRQLENLY